MKKTLLLIYLLFPTIYGQAQESKPNILYTWESMGSSVQCFTRYFFDKDFIKKDTLLRDVIFNHFKAKDRLINNFIISCDYILDIDQNEFIFRSKGINQIDVETIHSIQDTCDFGCYYQIIGDTVIFPCYNKRHENMGFVYFDLNQRKAKELPKNEQFMVDNILSPDKKKGLGYNHQTCEIELNSKTESVSLGKYYMKVDLSEQGHGSFPIIWLDNKSFLTQKSNGEIVKVDLYGNVKQIVNIKISKRGADKPFFHRDSNGDIFYFFDYYRKFRLFNKDPIKFYFYKIDINNKIYKKSLPSEYNFKLGISERKIVVNYDNEEIGRFIDYSDYKCKEGFIAVLQTTNDTNTINVWNEHSKTWWKYSTKSNIKILGWSNL